MKVPVNKSILCRADATCTGKGSCMTYNFLRPKISCAALTYLSPTGAQRPNCEFLCSLHICPPSSRKPPHLTSSPISWTSYPTFCPQTNGFTSLTTCRTVQTRQSHPPAGPTVTSPTCYYESCFLPSLIVYCIPSATPMWCAVSSPLSLP